MESERFPQVKIALRNCGQIDPENINHYIARGGYDGLRKALGMTAAELIEEVGKSGLQERSGGGFPLAEKWRRCLEAPGNEKIVVCNAAEGDPDSLIASTLLKEDPHSVLEGMLIGAWATGATRGVIYVSAHDTFVVNRLGTALSQARMHGLLGDSILDSNLNFCVEIREGSERLACSDETFLINEMQGAPTMPFVCSPRPPLFGLEAKPTLVHQVEIWAQVSAILDKDAGRRSVTKMFTIFGAVTQPGLIEVPLGTTFREIIYDIAGGLPNGRALKAIQIGGPTGGYLPASALDLPVDEEHLSAAGAIMGSGSILVIPGDACIVDQAKCSLCFIQNESCGKCVFCREGTRQMADIMTDITEGRGETNDIDLLLELGEGLKVGAKCDLGRTAPNPVLTAIRYFREEVEAHIKERSCQARACSTLPLC